MVVLGSLVLEGSIVVVLGFSVVVFCVVGLFLRLDVFTLFRGFLVVASVVNGLKVKDSTSKSNGFRSKELDKEDL